MLEQVGTSLPGNIDPQLIISKFLNTFFKYLGSNDESIADYFPLGTKK